MNTTDWLIAATAAGPVIGAILSRGLGKGLRALAVARAQRTEYIPADGADLYRHGVHLTETQFRDAYAAMQADLDQIPKGQRTDQDWKRQYDAVNRLSMLAGTFPQAFPMLGDADSAWQWYSTSSWYLTRDIPPRRRRALRPRSASAEP